MRSSRAIFIGLGGGILAGLFLGDDAAWFGVPAEVYVKLLQMTVLPYVVLSLVSGLGRLTHDQARLLGLRTGLVLLLLWALGLAMVFTFPLMFPPAESASFFSTTLLEPPRQFDLVDLYIPANPFHSLANTIVPAVVLFSVVMGVALIGAKDKDRLLGVLDVLRETVARATAFVVRLTPAGLFVIAAEAVGTLSLEQVTHLQIYLLAYGAMALLGAFWLVPGLVAVLTPIPYRRVLAATRDATLTAFVTAELFVVLPMLAESTRALAREYGLAGREGQAPDVIVAASFNFPHVGKVTTLSFILFAGWFAGTPVLPSSYPQLASTGLLSLFGSVNVAVPFLLDLFRIPADTYQLFIATSVINSRFGTLLAAMHTLAISLIGTWAMAGALRIDRARLAGYVGASLLLGAAVVGAVRGAADWLLPTQFEGRRIVYGMSLQRGHAEASLEPPGSSPPAALPGERVLDRIRRTGVLRVGYVEDNLPYSFVNDAGELVGLDVEMAHALARELDVRLALIPVTRERVDPAVRDGACDVVMSGVALTTDRAADALFSAPYMNETMAFVVPDHSRARFARWDALASERGLRLGVIDVPYYVRQLQARLPSARLSRLPTAEALFAAPRDDVDGLVMTAERGSAWTLLHPELSVVVPFPDPVKVPLAYPLAPDPDLARFVDAWIGLKRNDGTIDSLAAYWIFGRHAQPVRRRWSILRDVLGWRR